ncbi:aminoglycoside 6'-acetyltransferase [Salmonella enterica subsp. enterica serovar Enteritidis str. SA19940857]|uniref:GNAT family N-acetyltransferase n=1 Tax=Salmonella enterica TaxID=28901 RepID=UPI00043AF124|nr:GNAT family N-acetyltransferase [Salmonella enterica]AHV56462.1 aminoglycoside 6'-acetyltransferase [Salmonella enterica subsp. enterica serovar Enteritidis str. SA19940857]
MDIRQMNKTHLEHWRGLRKQLWPGHPDDAHLADGEEILQADHLASFPSFRQRGVAKQLIAAVQRWGTNKGCREMASDTTPENTISQKVHLALGFEETERVIFYRKRC